MYLPFGVASYQVLRKHSCRGYHWIIILCIVAIMVLLHRILVTKWYRLFGQLTRRKFSFITTSHFTWQSARVGIQLLCYCMLSLKHISLFGIHTNLASWVVFPQSISIPWSYSEDLKFFATLYWWQSLLEVSVPLQTVLIHLAGLFYSTLESKCCGISKCC